MPRVRHYHSPLPFIRTLLEIGADPNQRGINDYTPQHLAVSERNLTAVALLLDSVADHGFEHELMITKPLASWQRKQPYTLDCAIACGARGALDNLIIIKMGAPTISG